MKNGSFMKPEYIFLAVVYGFIIFTGIFIWFVLTYQYLKENWPIYKRKIRVKFARLKSVDKDR